ncbi:hypothetical protein SETIT_7G332000v2 [Setaria italica]|uniref:Transmembrane protein n=1 Tax=Setaria italica TaxID=4555 RepID=A0A368S2G7_SETIT|nr:hypothetical protein SETIT_7G332000v2 [Setaria italica]
MLHPIQRRPLRPQDRQGLKSSIDASGETTLFKSTDPEPERKKATSLGQPTQIAISGRALVFVAVAAATTHLLFYRRKKKDTTVMPWSTLESLRQDKSCFSIFTPSRNSFSC